MANGRCRMHRGKASRGAAAPNFKHGLYSKSIPTRLAGKFDAALADPNLLSVRNEAALLTALVDDALARLDAGETGALWLELRRAWRRAAKAGEDSRGAIMDEVGRLIERGASDADAALEVRAVVLDKVKVAESERKRLVDMQQMITVEQLMALVGALSSAVIAEVADRKVRGAILDRFERLLPAAGETDAVDAELEPAS